MGIAIWERGRERGGLGALRGTNAALSAMPIKCSTAISAGATQHAPCVYKLAMAVSLVRKKVEEAIKDLEMTQQRLSKWPQDAQLKKN